MTYYGLAQNTGGLPGAPFISYTASALAELPGALIDNALMHVFVAYLLAVPLMERLGRRPTLVIFYLLGGVSCIAAGALNERTLRLKNASRHSTLAVTEQLFKDIVLVLALVGKMCIMGAYSVIYNYSAEFFPTVARQAGTGFGSLFARFGSMLAPQIILLVSRATQIDQMPLRGLSTTRTFARRARRSTATCHSLCTAPSRASPVACASLSQKLATEHCLRLLRTASTLAAGQ